MLPVGLNACVAGEHKLAQYVKQSILSKKTDSQINDHISDELEAMEIDDSYEYSGAELERRKEVVIKLGKVLANLYLVDHVNATGRAVWEKLLSRQRKRAIVSCFRMTPLYNTPRHKVINTFTACYRDLWLKTEEIDFASDLIGQLANTKFDCDENEEKSNSTALVKQSSVINRNEENDPNLSSRSSDPLYQLISLFSTSAVISTRGLEEDPLYLVYSDLMSKSCSVEDELEDAQRTRSAI